MTERAACAVTQVKITGCFILVSKAARWLMKHVAVPTFSLGFSLGGEFLQGSCAGSPAGQARRDQSCSQLLTLPGGEHVLQGEMWLGFLDRISSPCCYSRKYFTDC